jgi:two-component system cell cycle response regulator DivK
VVEDTEMSRELLVQLLEDDYEISVAADGAQGLEAVRAEQPEVVLMDLSLPVMDGWEATRRIKADPALRDTIVIAVTANAMPGDEAEARAAGADGYLTKPIDEDLLFETLRSYLGGSPQ